MMKKEITAIEYGMLNHSDRNKYTKQYQEWDEPQHGSGRWNDISETKSSYSNNLIQKVYRLYVYDEQGEDMIALQSNLRNLLFIRPFDLIAVETAAVKLCDAVLVYADKQN